MLNLKKLSKKFDKLLKKVTKKDFEAWLIMDEKRAKDAAEKDKQK